LSPGTDGAVPSSALSAGDVFHFYAAVQVPATLPIRT